jgi:hypothetical protein
MGVINEATAKHLVSLQQAGQSGNTILKEFQGTMQLRQQPCRPEVSVEEYRARLINSKSKRRPLGAPWMEEQTNELKRRSFSGMPLPAAGKFGRLFNLPLGHSTF